MAIWKYVALGLFIGTSFYSSLIAQNRSFPQQVNYPGCIKPDYLSQDNMNIEVAKYYKGWKDDFLKSTGSTPGGYYINTGGGTGSSGDAVTVSEAHGYGMIIFALMAGGDSEAKVCFDGMYKVFRDHPSKANDDLMSWEIRGKNGSEIADPSHTASDGDLDMAYALLLAHDQWGSDGAINYLAEATKMIAAIKAHCMDSQSKRVMLGSWDHNQWSTRSSDWMSGHLRAFCTVTNNIFWSRAADTVYGVLAGVRNSATGLVPDFVVGQNPVPADPDFLEGSHDGHYYNNACRVPWRIAMDFAHYQKADAKEAVTGILDWLVIKTKGNPDNISNGYTLSGTSINTSDPWGSYLGPFIAACVVDKQYQDYLNRGWKEMKTYHSYGKYYSNTLTLLCMLFISGNWWKQGEAGVDIIHFSKNGMDNFNVKSTYNSSMNSLWVHYTLKNPAQVHLTLVTSQGKVFFQTPVEQNVSGTHKLVVELSGRTLSNGVYFLRLNVNNRKLTQQITIVR